MRVDEGGHHWALTEKEIQDAERRGTELAKKRIKAYQAIAKHIYEAHWLYGDSTHKQIIILADSIDEAREKAEKVFGVCSFSVRQVAPTEDPQVYEI